MSRSRKFKVVLEQESDGGYSVHVPALPGCASQGDTLEEALKNIHEAIELYVWSLKDDGLPIPEEDHPIIVQDVEIVV